MSPAELTELLYLLDAIEAFPTRGKDLLKIARKRIDPSNEFKTTLDRIKPLLSKPKALPASLRELRGVLRC